MIAYQGIYITFNKIAGFLSYECYTNNTKLYSVGVSTTLLFEVDTKVSEDFRSLSENIWIWADVFRRLPKLTQRPLKIFEVLSRTYGDEPSYKFYPFKWSLYTCAKSLHQLHRPRRPRVSLATAALKTPRLKWISSINTGRSRKIYINIHKSGKR